MTVCLSYVMVNAQEKTTNFQLVYYYNMPKIISKISWEKNYQMTRRSRTICSTIRKNSLESELNKFMLQRAIMPLSTSVMSSDRSEYASQRCLRVCESES